MASIIIASDIHAQTTGMFARPTAAGLTTRAETTFKFLEWLHLYAIQIKATTICIAGDLFTHRTIQPSLFNRVFEIFRNMCRQIPVVAIPGNHDRYTVDDVHPQAHSLYVLGKGIKNFHVIDQPSASVSLPDAEWPVGLEILGIPAGWESDVKLGPWSGGKLVPKNRKCRILLAHENVDEAIYPNGEVAGIGLNRQEFVKQLKSWEIDACFIGDIHEPQILPANDPRKDWVWSDRTNHYKPLVMKPGDIVLPGAPYQMDFGDEGRPRGVVVYDVQYRTAEFVPWKGGPQYVTVTDETFENEPKVPYDKGNPVRPFVRYRISDPANARRLDEYLSKDEEAKVNAIVEYEPDTKSAEVDLKSLDMDPTELVKAYVESAASSEKESVRRQLVDMGLAYVDTVQKRS